MMAKTKTVKNKLMKKVNQWKALYMNNFQKTLR